MNFDINKYWKNREKNKRGQGETPKPTILKASGATISFDNQGNMVVVNRAYKRRRIKSPGNSQQITNKGDLQAHLKLVAKRKRLEHRKAKMTV